MSNTDNTKNDIEEAINRKLDKLKYMCILSTILSSINVFWLNSRILSLIVIMITVYIIFSFVKVRKLLNEMSSITDKEVQTKINDMLK